MNESELKEFVEQSKKCRIYIKRLPSEFENDTQKSFYESYGPVKTAYCVFGTRSRKNFKYGYVFFENPETVQKLPLEGLPYKGGVINWIAHRTKFEIMGDGQQENHSYLNNNSMLQSYQMGDNNTPVGNSAFPPHLGLAVVLNASGQEQPAIIPARPIF